MKQLSSTLFLLLVLIVSCKKDPQKSEEIVIPKEEIVLQKTQVFCYQGIIKKDTINLKFEIDSNQVVKGDLSYIHFEKDKNRGTILGQMNGDTLKANYNFFSEGTESEREIVFLKKGKIMIEAYGDTEEKENKTVFKNPKKLFFDSATVLSEIDCITPK